MKESKAMENLIPPTSAQEAACYGPGPSYPQYCYEEHPPAPLVIQPASIAPGSLEFSVLLGLGFFVVGSLIGNLIIRRLFK
jgi:hypothetical protein